MSIHAYISRRVVFPDRIAPAAVIVDTGSGIILRIAEPDAPGPVDLIHDLGNHALLPGLIDPHVHLNEPGRTDWEGFETGTRAAAAGGITTLVDMPLNCLPPTTTVAGLEAKRAAAQGKSMVDWRPWGGAENGNQPHLAALAAAGVPGFKAFLVDPGCEGLGLLDEANLRAAIPILAQLKLPLLVHAEHPAELGAPPSPASSVRVGSTDPDPRKYANYLASRPDQAEVAAIRLLLDLCGDEVPLHIVHLATAQGLSLLREAKSSGQPVTVETCPHYLYFAAEDIPDGSTLHKCAPPIRSRANRDLLRQAVIDGTIDLIASDHSPCPPAMKRLDTGDFMKAWGGIASLSLGTSILATVLGAPSRSASSNEVGSNDALLTLARLMSANPAKLAGVAHRKGRIAPGFDADFAVFAPEEIFTVTPADLYFRHPISPYLGEQLTGRIKQTILRGTCIFNNGTFPTAPIGRELSTPGAPSQSAPSIEVGSTYVLDLCARIAAHTDAPGTITRTFLSPATRDVHALLTQEMLALGMTVRADSAANLRGIYPAANPDAPVLLIGSHIDTVPDAGPYDGVLGVAIAIALIRSLNGRKLPYAIEIIAFSEEEGVRFKFPFIGSRALVGTLTPDDLARTDANGITIAQALTDHFGVPHPREARVGPPTPLLTPNTFAYLEVHIEQGPVLESLDLPLGVVTGIIGQSRLGLTFHGEANHAGTTPMSFRKDALAAAARFIAEVQSYPVSDPALLATVGSIAALPGAANVIPGTVTLSLDVRHPSDAARLAAVEALKILAQSHGIPVTITDRGAQSSVPMDPALTTALTAAAAPYAPHAMPSGAGHDAMILAPHVPSAMLFLRTPRGLSHHPQESVSAQDIQAALQTCLRFLDALHPTP